MHQFIILEDDIYTLDTPAERAEARIAMAEAGVDSLPIMEGEAGVDGEPTGERINAATSLEDADYPNRGSYTLAGWLKVLLDKDSDDDMRAEVLEQIVSLGAGAMNYDEAGLLTQDDGIVFRTRGACEYQITIKRSR